jgi:hypothetical protein
VHLTPLGDVVLVTLSNIVQNAIVRRMSVRRGVIGAPRLSASMRALVHIRQRRSGV